MAVAGFLLLLFMVNLRPGVSAAHFNYTSSPRKPKLDSRYFPSPILQPVKCGRVNKSFVCDPEKILLPIQAKQLDDLISSKTNTFKCVCKEKCVSYRDKYVIMVAIAPRIKVKKGATMEEKKLAVDTFAKDLLERGWAGGNCDNDIIIVLSTEYRRIYVKVGAKPRKVLSDACITSATDTVSSGSLKHGDYSRGLENLVEILSDNVETCRQDRKQPKKDNTWIYFLGFGLGGFVLTCFGCCICKKKHYLCFKKPAYRYDWAKHRPGTSTVSFSGGKQSTSSSGGTRSTTYTARSSDYSSSRSTSGGGYRPSRSRSSTGGFSRSWDDHGYSGGGGGFSSSSGGGGGGCSSSGGGGDSGGGGCDSGGGGSDF